MNIVSIPAQVYNPDLQEFLPKAYGALPLSRKIGSREAAQEPLKTWEHNVGFDERRTPSGFLGSALFAGGLAYQNSMVEVKLPKTMVKDEITVMLWFKSSDIAGRKTLVV